MKAIFDELWPVVTFVGGLYCIGMECTIIGIPLLIMFGYWLGKEMNHGKR